LAFFSKTGFKDALNNATDVAKEVIADIIRQSEGLPLR
jgi:hypothetical protein